MTREGTSTWITLTVDVGSEDCLRSKWLDALRGNEKESKDSAQSFSVQKK
jgi:hypothetical protein